ncbi:hypothetical protein HS041_28185 [Planomonospora sp. ID67723]|uniref:hypothetical protein n=1 Tax=Planomonospora sp. ID67723 TaxID=2738134 RepID=UPI0018C41348|nr:hypothetical protein [Planomonospora sp. ID67723]MBG0831614.1 hypothetical protein [Planomonospora sp. ID67723]
MQRRGRIAGGRPNRYNVRLTDAEDEEFTAAAEQSGVTVPYLMVESTRAALRGGGRMSAVEAREAVRETHGIWRQMRVVGVDLEHLMAATASGSPGEAALQAAMDQLTRTLQRADRLMDMMNPDRRTAS